jgi:hypothetical protein
VRFNPTARRIAIGLLLKDEQPGRTPSISRGGTFFFPGASPMDSLQTFDLYKVQGLFASPGALSGLEIL